MDNYVNYIESFYEKEHYLQQYFEEVEPMDFYRYIFPQGSFERCGHQEDWKPNGIVVGVSSDETYIKERKRPGPNGEMFDVKSVVRRKMITDELTELQEIFDEVESGGPRGLDFYTMPAVSYIGLQRTLDNARYLHALVLDIDGLDHVDYLHDLVYQFEQDVTPKPTFIVNSGHGVHLYFVFENPIPLYPNYRKHLKELKYQLVRRIWNKYTSADPKKQYQSIVQAFRMVGTLNKDGQLLKAYQTGDRCTVEDLAKYFPDNPINTYGLDMPRKMTLHEAKHRYPEWYERRVSKGIKSTENRWHVKRDLYDWYLDKVKTEAVFGHRYFAVMALAIFARKCDVSYDELESDAYALVPVLDKLTEKNSRFTEDDVASALAAYQDRYVTFPRKDIEWITQIKMPENKRNGQKQVDHLEEARAIRDIRMRRQGRKWNDNGGRPSAEQQVRDWQDANPGKRKADCSKETGLDPKTVRKWWKS